MKANATLGDVLELQRGHDLPEVARRAGSVPVIGSAGVTGYHDTARVKGPGVTMGRSGASFGKVTFVREDYWPHNACLFVKDFKGNDVRFVAYLLESIDFSSFNSGSAQQSLNRNFLYGLSVWHPPPPAQVRIAGILSAYDDLIENCERRIRILDEMARTLYREWFVQFRYPGHEKVPLVDSPLGKIPKGWEARTIGDLGENFDRMRKPLSKMQREERPGPYPYYGAAKVFDFIDDYIFDGEYLLLAEDGSVSTTDSAPVLQLVDGKFWPNNHTHILRGRPPISTHFLYLALSGVSVLPYITGAAQPKITQENMNRIPLVRAPSNVHEEFDMRVAPLLALVHVLSRYVASLRKARDLLLPRLLSGQLDVGEAA